MVQQNDSYKSKRHNVAVTLVKVRYNVVTFMTVRYKIQSLDTKVRYKIQS